MIEITTKDVLPLTRKLPEQEKQQLIETITAEHPPEKRNPFLELIGGWAEMGDEGIDEFNTLIEQIRQEPSRPVTFPEEDA